MTKWCVVIVAPKVSSWLRAYSTAFEVVMCSITTRKPGVVRRMGSRTRSINTASRSKMSISLSVTSPCTQSGKPISAIRSSVGRTLSKWLTPEDEFVVAPAGYNFTALIRPEAWAAATSSGSVCSVRYSVIKGSKVEPSGSALSMRSRYPAASADVTTGGTRFGMIIARAKCVAVEGRTACSILPSRR